MERTNHEAAPRTVHDLLGWQSASEPAALFVDFENVYYKLVSEPVSLARDAGLTAALDALDRVRARFRAEGCALSVERSYADWDRIPGGAQRRLQLAGVVPRFVASRVGKGTADLEL
jgi:hypothetical protein